jgi:hypothetical protein
MGKFRSRIIGVARQASMAIFSVKAVENLAVGRQQWLSSTIRCSDPYNRGAHELCGVITGFRKRAIASRRLLQGKAFVADVSTGD